MGLDVTGIGGVNSTALLPHLDATSLQAERLIRESSSVGVVDVAALARSTYAQPLADATHGDALRDAIAQHLDERDREAYLSASQAAHPITIAQNGGALPLAPIPQSNGSGAGPIERIGTNPSSFVKPNFDDLPPAANDNDPGRLPLRLLSRTGAVIALPLLLSGDTPQPQREARLIPGTSDLALVQVRSGLTDKLEATYFAKVEQRATPLAKVFGYSIGPTVGTEPVLTRLDVPVTTQNDELRYDPAALEHAYGRAVPGWTGTPSLDSEDQAWAAALRAAGAQPEQVNAELENLRAERGTSANRADPRNQTGTAHVTARLTTIEGPWLRGTQGNAGLFPAQVAEQLNGREFRNFNEFRAAFWKAVADTPSLASQFSPSNQAAMRNGNAPIAVETQWFGGSRSYTLHHTTPIAKGGGVYDMSNLTIVTPRIHQEILWKRYHFGQQ
jgi:hypothetical protein